ncbi:cell wall integrity and stress response component 4-like isoform X2 [Daphnia pulicaria]|nr:cell wall integrity and stress response component 4-like isoform X2 [Daphnia pulicaria]
MRLECNPGYRPSDSPMIYCVDKFDWNGTAPLCQASGVQQSATRCDFESDDLCGWVQDTRTDEFDWTWQNYGTPSFHLGTGPSFDHTLGQGKAGHYLFIESSSPRVLNDTARLFSPVYGQPEASAVADEGVCFSFWFHMYGSTTGQINVFIKPESKKMSELRPAFVRSGDQGDRWRQGYISLDTVTENFQVVIEGVRGTGYVGDSAIDDVQLTKGEECLAALKRMMADTIVPGGSTAPPSSTIPPNASCSTRCSTSERTEETANTNTSSSSSSWTCGCSDDCLLKNSCCSDYAAFCLTGRTGTSTATATTVTTTTASPPQTTTTITTTLAPPPSQAIASSTTTTTTTTTETPTIPTTTFRPTAAATTTTTASSVPIPTTMPTTLAISSTTPIPPSTSSSTVIMSTVATTQPTTVTSTTTTTTERPTTTSTTSTTVRSSTTTIPTTRTTTTTTAKPTTTTTTRSTATNPTTTTSTTTTTTAVPTNTFRTWVVPTTRTPLATTTTPAPTRPTTTTSVLVTGDPPQDGLQGDDDQSGLAADQPSPSASSQTSSPKWLIGTVVAAAVGVALLLMIGVVVAVIRSRNSVSDRRRRPKLRSNQQDQLAEDSDVRYLRDEDDVQLDLTEATPSSKSTGSHRQFADFERL